MLSNFFRRLSVSIRNYDENKGFSFFVPIQAISEPFEDFVDFMNLIALIVPKVSVDIKAKDKVTFKAAVGMLEVGERVILELGHYGAFDLVDVKTEDTSVRIGIK